MTALRRLPTAGEPRRGKFEELTPEQAFQQFGRETRRPFRLMVNLSDAEDLEQGMLIRWHEGAEQGFRAEWLMVETVQRHGVLGSISHAVVLVEMITPSEEGTEGE